MNLYLNWVSYAQHIVVSCFLNHSDNVSFSQCIQTISCFIVKHTEINISETLHKPQFWPDVLLYQMSSIIAPSIQAPASSGLSHWQSGVLTKQNSTPVWLDIVSGGKPFEYTSQVLPEILSCLISSNKFFSYLNKLIKQTTNIKSINKPTCPPTRVT